METIVEETADPTDGAARDQDRSSCSVPPDGGVICDQPPTDVAVKGPLGPQSFKGLLRALGPRASVEREADDCVQVRVAAADFARLAERAREECGARFVFLTGVDRRECSGCFEVVGLLAQDEQQTSLRIRTSVDRLDPAIPSITSAIPAASWAERELHDLFGIRAVGHPNLSRLVLPDDWPAGSHPLRRDSAYSARPPSEPRTEHPRALPEGVRVTPIGPFFPGLREPAFFAILTDGETIVDVEHAGFYSHKGAEKLGDSALLYQAIPTVAQRLCGACGSAQRTGYCQAVESAAEIGVPPRAEYLRLIVAEVERVHSHLRAVGATLQTLGFETMFMQLRRICEPLLRFAESVWGSRLMYDLSMIGGVRRDLAGGEQDQLLRTVGALEKEVAVLRELLADDSSVRTRLEAVGVLSSGDARKCCVTGPVARASGLPLDTRTDRPSGAYHQLQPTVQTQADGDNWARLLVRIDEVLASTELIRRAVADMPDGPLAVEVNRIPPDREGLSWVEAPGGELVHYVVTGPARRPLRWHVRSPSYINLQALPAILAGEQLADASVTVGTVATCFACAER